MRKIIILILFSSSALLCSAQRLSDSITLEPNIEAALKGKHVCIWGDTTYMKLHTNNKIYIFKSGLKDGQYTAFYDSTYKDTAMTVTFEDGEMNGILKRWFDGEIEEETQYKEGYMNGYRKLYYFEDGKEYINIQLFDDMILIAEPQIEW